MAVDGGTNPIGSENPVDWLSSQKGTAFLIRAFVDFSTIDPDSGGRGEDYAAPAARHLETANVLYVDGHVKSSRVEKFYDRNVFAPNRMPCLDPNVGCG
jgi:prepilin-type processing-associated H-X9-DG protein